MTKLKVKRPFGFARRKRRTEKSGQKKKAAHPKSKPSKPSRRRWGCNWVRCLRFKKRRRRVPLQLGKVYSCHDDLHLTRVLSRSVGSNKMILTPRRLADGNKGDYNNNGFHPSHPHPLSHKAQSLNPKSGRYVFKHGDVFQNRYKILGIISRGFSSDVVDAFDKETKMDVVIKVVRDVDELLIQGTAEAVRIERFSKDDLNAPSIARHFCVKLENNFEMTHNGNHHRCLVFKQYGQSLRRHLDESSLRGFSVHSIKSIALQLFHTLNFLHETQFTAHTDLRLEHILFYHDEDEQPKIKLIGFGAALSVGRSGRNNIITSSACCRSPEVLLIQAGVKENCWGFASDIWSAGCILAELVMGKPFFGSGLDEQTAVKQLWNIANIVDEDLLSIPMVPEDFKVRLMDEEEKSGKNRLEDVISLAVTGDCFEVTREMCWRRELLKLIDFLKQILVVDPEKRLSANDLLAHEFLEGCELP